MAFPGLRLVAVLALLHASTSAANSFSADKTGDNSNYSSAMRRGLEERKNGAFHDALHSFEIATRIAGDARDMKGEAAAMNRQATCFIYLFQYRQALALANAALDLGRSMNSDEIMGVSESNRATIYEQLGDYTLAENSAREAVGYLSQGPNKRAYVAALTNYGDILDLSGNTDAALVQFRQAIALASGAGIAETEAMAENRMGEAMADSGDPAAMQQLKHSYDLYRSIGDYTSAALARADMAGLARTQHDYRQSLQILDELRSSRSFAAATVLPFWETKMRGECLLALSREREALVQFDKSVRLARQWRRSSLPSDATSTKTLVAVHGVFENYIGLAAKMAVRDHDQALSRQALAVLMEHRASTLREQMIATLGRQMTLPPLYFELLSQIQTEQAAVTLGASKDLAAKRANLQRLQERLAEVENAVGLQSPSTVSAGGTGSSVTLTRVQHRLLRQELLLSFFLGKERSYVWAVTNDKVFVYELPAESVIAADAKAFSQAARAGQDESAGERLRQDLLSKIDPELQSRPEWLIAADGALLDSVPLSALPESATSDRPLIASHSLRFTPSELLLDQPETNASSGYFIGVADPIYNLADSRLPAGKVKKRPGSRTQAGLTLARLVASDREVRTASQTTGFKRVELLSGAMATGQNLREQLNATPEVLHFAVHVVSPQDSDGVRGEEAGLALSIGSDGLPELLTKEMISTLRVPGTLVVLSGCASQQGKPLPGAGMIGLSRAWLLAGASAVLVTAWPTPDDSGKFFGDFYSRLQAEPKTKNIASRAAAALEATQIDMQHSPGYMSERSFWAAYSLISKE